MHMQVGDDDLTLQAVFSGLAPDVVTGYTWSSASSSATVTAIGNGGTATLHAVSAGTANITVTANLFTGAPLTHTMSLTVWAADVPQVGILVQTQTGQLYPDDPAGPGGGGQIPSPGNLPE